MSMSDVITTIEHPEIGQMVFNTEPVQCHYCGRTMPAGSCAQQVRVTKWHDWDNPDENAQGQYEYSQSVEWYCLNDLACIESLLTQGTNAEPEAVIELVKRAGKIPDRLTEYAWDVINERRKLDREAAHLMADIEHYAQYDDRSPGHTPPGDAQ